MCLLELFALAISKLPQDALVKKAVKAAGSLARTLCSSAIS